MDIEEAKIIIDILKTGSKFYQPPNFESYEDNVEGIFIEYKPETNSFLLKRYEKDDLDWHIFGYDEKLVVTEERLIEMFTGKKFDGYLWWSLTAPNNYIFDFEKPKKPKKTKAMRILDEMDLNDYSSLICSHCYSKNVEPTSYSTSLNIGGANRYVSLSVYCLNCGKDSSYSWDD